MKRKSIVIRGMLITIISILILLVYGTSQSTTIMAIDLNSGKQVERILTLWGFYVSDHYSESILARYLTDFNDPSKEERWLTYFISNSHQKGRHGKIKTDTSDARMRTTAELGRFLVNDTLSIAKKKKILTMIPASTALSEQLPNWSIMQNEVCILIKGMKLSAELESKLYKMAINSNDIRIVYIASIVFALDSSK